VWNIIQLDLKNNTVDSLLRGMMNIYGRPLGEVPDHNDMVALSIHTRYELDVGGTVVALHGTGDEIWFATLGNGGRAVSVGDMLFMVRGIDIARMQLEYLFPDYNDQIADMEPVFPRTELEGATASGYVSAAILGDIHDGVSIRTNT